MAIPEPKLQLKKWRQKHFESKQDTSEKRVQN